MNSRQRRTERRKFARRARGYLATFNAERVEPHRTIALHKYGRSISITYNPAPYMQRGRDLVRRVLNGDAERDDS